MFGITCQIYSLVDRRLTAAGDYRCLAELAAQGAGAGVDFIGINPVHASFAARPEHASPYSPSDRRFLDWRYIALEHEPRAASRQQVASEVDWPSVLRAKLAALRVEYRRAARARDRSWRRFEAFKHRGAAELERFCWFEALDAQFGRERPASWREWPQAYRDPASPEVAAFARENTEELEFHAYLQWRADEQLAAAHRRALAAGMRVGLYRDLAIGVDPSGSAVWQNPKIRISDVSIGAPPDALSSQGQNWGLAPLSPRALRETAYEPFLEDVRAAMRHAGALRIDHVMGLQRLYWIPSGASAKEGAYVRYPFADLVGLTALVSSEQRCLVIGEDLGTVPSGFRAIMRRAGILSCRILYFERNRAGSFRSARQYPRLAAASIASHDLPPLRGYWEGRDIEWRASIGHEADAAGAHRTRQAEKAALLARLRREQLFADGSGSWSNTLHEAVHRFIARTASVLALIQLEDLVAAKEQMNLPGTTTEHPNWRRRLNRRVQDIFADPQVKRLLAGIRRERRSRVARHL
jgi:4-alpha-glucanotransferase